MADIKLKIDTEKAESRPSTARWLFWISVVLVLFLIVAYFGVTSSPFIKRFVLPRVGATLNAELAAERVGLSPFSRLDMRGVKLTPRNEATLLTADHLRVRYSLVAFMQGRFEVEELRVESATVSLVEKPDGTSNLSPLLHAARKASTRSKTAASSAPPALSIKSLVFTNLALRHERQRTGAPLEVFQVTGLGLQASDIGNGKSGKLDLGARLALETSGGRSNEAPASIEARLTGNLVFQLGPDLSPSFLQGETVLSVEKAGGAANDLTGVTATLVADVTPTEIKRFDFGLAQAGARVGGVQIRGPFNFSKREGKLNLEVTSIDRRGLNLIGARAGLDFGTTRINSTNEIELAKAGSVVSIFGDLRLTGLQVISQGHSTPTLDLSGDYSVAVDRNTKSAVIGSMKFAGTQNRRPFLTAGLTSPMTITWGKSGDTVGNSTFNFSATDLDLAEWKPFLAGYVEAGQARVEGKVMTKEDGKLVSYECKVYADGLTVLASDKRFDGLTLTLDAAGEAKEFKQFKISEYGAQIFQAGQPAFSFQGSARADTMLKTADADVAMLGSLPQLATLFMAHPGALSSGVLEVRGKFIQKPGTNLFAGKLRLVDLTVKSGQTAFEHFGSDMDMELFFDPGRLKIRKASGAFSEGTKQGGKFEVSGTFQSVGTTDLVLKLHDINHFGLRPFLEPALGGKKLATASLNATSTLAISSVGNTTFKADFALTNLTAKDPRFPSVKASRPLQARLQVDTQVANHAAQLRQCQLTLTPTEKARNQIGLAGSVDFSKTNAITGNLKLSAESLDLTAFYDLFSAPSPAVQPAPVLTPTAPASAPATEPQPIPFAFKDFAGEVNIVRLVIRETEMASIQARARIDGTRAVLKPGFVALNGAPVKFALDLDLGVPGYRYDINFDAQQVPIAPIVNTFQPERKGQLAGQFTGLVAIKGEGVSDQSLQKNLTGHIQCLATNLNLSLANARTPLITTLVNTVVGIPDVIRNPLASVEGLVGRLVNFGGQRGGWSDQLMSAPIEVVEARIEAGEGRVRLEQAEVRSSAFRARATGDISLDSTLTNSTIRIPVAISLTRSLADKIGLVPADAPTNAAFYAMPQFLELQGTLGRPETQLDKVALAELAALTGVSVVKGVAVSGKVDGLVQKGGNLLGPLVGGARNPAPTVSPTNAPAITNRSSGTFDLFK